MARGGSRHIAVKGMDLGVLTGILGRHRDLIMDLGRYERRARQDGVDGIGLVKLAPLLSELLDVAPNGRLHPGSIRAACLDLAIKNPGLNGTAYNNGVFAGMRQERLGVVFNHLRRLKREAREGREGGAREKREEGREGGRGKTGVKGRKSEESRGNRRKGGGTGGERETRKDGEGEGDRMSGKGKRGKNENHVLGGRGEGEGKCKTWGGEGTEGAIHS